MPDLPDLQPPRGWNQQTFDAIHYYAKKYVFPVFDAIVNKLENLGQTVRELQTRDAASVWGRQALRDAGHTPTDWQVADFVDECVRRGFTGRHVQAEPREAPPGYKPPSTFYLDRKVLQWDAAAERLKRLPDAEHPAAPTDDAPTRDVERRVAAHARHLQNIDKRLQKVEHKAP